MHQPDEASTDGLPSEARWLRHVRQQLRTLLPDNLEAVAGALDAASSAAYAPAVPSADLA